MMVQNVVKKKGRKTDKKDQGGIERSKEKPSRIKKVITVEDGPTFCEKRWKQTAMNDPDNTWPALLYGSPPKSTLYASQTQNILQKKIGEEGFI